jgi:ParB family chromosome partitioning protein
MLTTVKVDELNPASYNPRKLDAAAEAALRQSIETFGVIKAVIVRDPDMTIMAGHQRTKMFRALGIAEVPCYRLTNISTADEVRFNQLHNIIEAPAVTGETIVAIRGDLAPGWNTVHWSRIDVVKNDARGSFIKELSKLYVKYGPYANAVANRTGDVIGSANYAIACRLLRKPLDVFVTPTNRTDFLADCLARDYGQFSYDHIKRTTYVQSLAQKLRLRTEGKGSKSTLYETRVIPGVSKQTRILDFGSGQFDYVNRLKKQGYNIKGLEFFRRRVGADVIDVPQVTRDFEDMMADLDANGPFEVVVCDSVMNSVDSPEAERAVLSTLSVLCKKGGTIYWSGIPINFIELNGRAKRTGNVRSYFKYLDADRFTADYRQGRWYFQHYHDLATAEALTRQYLGDSFTVYSKGIEQGARPKFGGSAFQVRVINEARLSFEDQQAALDFEFSMELPSGKRYQFAERIKAWNEASYSHQA